MTSFRSELRRGVNAWNLGVAAITSVAAAAGWFAAALLGAVPVVGRNAALDATVLGGALFLTITALHTAAHAWFGWRLELGIRAARDGRSRVAVRLLSVVERRGMSHYDEDGTAAAALAESRRKLGDEESP